MQLVFICLHAKSCLSAVVFVQLSVLLNINKWLCTAKNTSTLCLFLLQKKNGGEYTLS